MFFFFQAEDGIRDLVRSRGLGDVYKRQIVHRGISFRLLVIVGSENKYKSERERRFLSTNKPVSYTHLTLPTSDLV